MPRSHFVRIAADKIIATIVLFRLVFLLDMGQALYWLVSTRHEMYYSTKGGLRGGGLAHFGTFFCDPFGPQLCCGKLKFTTQHILFVIIIYLEHACLIDHHHLKSNRSGLWRHMLETCRRLRRLCRKHSNNVARHDKTPVKSTLVARQKYSVARHKFHVA